MVGVDDVEVERRATRGEPAARHGSGSENPGYVGAGTDG